VLRLVCNATFNNISAISWQSVLLVVETGVPVEHHRPVANHWQTLSHNVVSSTPTISRHDIAEILLKVVLDTINQHYCNLVKRVLIIFNITE
jgi:hypothetical protein